MRRRDFITLLAGMAVSGSNAVRAQQTAPAIGFLAQGYTDAVSDFVAATKAGIAEAGLAEGKDFTSEFGWANNDPVRLPGLVADLVRHRPKVIVAVDSVPAARAAKAATADIPIVFVIGADPVQAGLVANLSRPAGNITGISSMNLDLGSKWVGLLHELLPAAKRFAVLVNFATGESARSLITQTQAGGLTMGLQIEFVFAANDDEIDQAVAGLGARAQALIVQPDTLFVRNWKKLAALAIREKLPTIGTAFEFAKAGALMSYGSDFVDAHRVAGVYVGRILKGEKPADLPVQQATKFQFVLNLKTAKAIGLDIPPTLLARADEVIE